MAEGHNEPCYYCEKPCNSFAGNPSKWPIPLCHADDPGRVKWHHIGCVTERLIENGGHEAAKTARREATALHNFIIEHGLLDQWNAERDQQLADLSD